LGIPNRIDLKASRSSFAARSKIDGPEPRKNAYG
jgi:hypothetical protein